MRRNKRTHSSDGTRKSDGISKIPRNMLDDEYLRKKKVLYERSPTRSSRHDSKKRSLTGADHIDDNVNSRSQSSRMNSDQRYDHSDQRHNRDNRHHDYNNQRHGHSNQRHIRSNQHREHSNQHQDHSDQRQEHSNQRQGHSNKHLDHRDQHHDHSNQRHDHNNQQHDHDEDTYQPKNQVSLKYSDEYSTWKFEGYMKLSIQSMTGVLPLTNSNECCSASELEGYLKVSLQIGSKVNGCNEPDQTRKLVSNEPLEIGPNAGINSSTVVTNIKSREMSAIGDVYKLYPSIKFTEFTVGKIQSISFVYMTTVQGRRFIGEGKSLKAAKLKCCENLLIDSRQPATSSV